MIFDRALIKFDRDNFDFQEDFTEKVGDFGLGLLRIGCGTTLNVEIIPKENGQIGVFNEKVYSLAHRIAAMAIFIFALPLTALFAGIGFIATTFSNSHNQIFDLYRPMKNEDLSLGAGVFPNLTNQINTENSMTNFGNAGEFTLELNSENVKKVTDIQKYVRGFLVRKHLLSPDLYPEYRAHCEAAKDKKCSMPKAKSGETPVYLPKEMPSVVLKKSGKQKAISRFHQMSEVRNILEAQGSTHLVIPKANLCKEFLVEERLPINIDSYHNMELYLSQPELFNEAVREMARLFSVCHLGDLVNKQVHPLSHIENIGDEVRYDNLPFYVVEENGKKEGKIGLIDLESFTKVPNPGDFNVLARIFPLHLNLIKEEASKLGVKIDLKTFEASAEKGVKSLKVGFTDHLEWLKKKGFIENYFQLFELSPEREKELAGLIQEELLKLNNETNDLFRNKGLIGKLQKPLFKENPEKMANELAPKIVPLIINNIKSQIQQSQEGMKVSKEQMTEGELVSLRSPMIKRNNLHEGLDTFIIENTMVEGFSGPKDTAEQLVFVVMQALAKGGEIFYYDPVYYAHPKSLCWIRY